MMNHIDENILELYLLDSEKVSGQRENIEAHLKECNGCFTLCTEMKQYYFDVEEIRRERERTQTQAITLRGMVARVAPYEKSIPVMPYTASAPARIILFVIRHYVTSGIVMVAMIASMIYFFYPKTTPRDLNPSYARAKDEFLVTYNKNGEELWRKHVGTGFDIYLAKWPLNRRAIFTGDGNKDGRNEIFCIYGDRPDLPFTGAIVCYDWDGSIRWKYEFHRTIQFGDELFTDDYFFNSMLVGDFDNNGILEIIAEAGHEKRYPNVVIRIDAMDGRPLNEYWHAGNIEYMTARDMDGDNIKEIILTNTSTFYEAAPLIILDPRFMNGHSPMPEEHTPRGIPPGTEKYYLLLPRSGVELSKNFLSTAGEVLYFKTNGILETIVYDRMKDGTSFALNFYFDSQMRCVTVFASEPNLSYYRKLEQEELSLRTIDQQYIEDVKRSVRYWDGEKFVTEPTMNRRFVALVRPAQ